MEELKVKDANEIKEEEKQGGQYAVRWRARSYVSTVTGALAGLRDTAQLTDVTLSCEGEQVAAHRVLLAACSPYFRNLFQDHPSPHPIIIFRNVRHRDLLAVVHFIYHGEVSMPHDSLAAFLNTAELLQVRGLCDGPPLQHVQAQGQPQTHPRPPAPPIPPVAPIPPASDYAPTESSRSDPLLAPPESKRRKLAKRDLDLDCDSLPRPSLDILDDPSVSRDDTDHLILQPDNSMPSFPDNIDICDTETFQTPSILSNLKPADANSDPAADITIDGISRETVNDGDVVKFRCQVCWKGFKHPTSLTLHKDSHTGKTQCPVCHRSFSRSYDMRSHLMKIHQDQPASDSKPKTGKSSTGNNT